MSDFYYLLNLCSSLIFEKYFVYGFVNEGIEYLYDNRLLLRFKKSKNLNMIVDSDRLKVDYPPKLFFVINLYSRFFKNMKKRFYGINFHEFKLYDDTLINIIEKRCHFINKIWQWNKKIFGTSITPMGFIPFGYIE